MKTHIKNVTLSYPDHKLHNKKVNLLINNGLIESINPKTLPKNCIDIDAQGMILLPSLIDVQCFNGEPGFEEREDFDSLTRSAKNGGFSQVFVMPSSNPVVDSKSGVAFIKNASGLNGVQIHPIGAVSKELKGKDLSEMYDMHLAGAKAFSDAKSPINDVNLMKRALEYVKSFNGTVYSFPLDERVAPGGMVNESPANTMLGLKSTPKLAEELMLNRDIYLLDYTQSKLHVSAISSKGSIDLISKAKSRNLNITCSVALSNLLFNENVLESFDTNYKTNPPLRSEEDRKALIKGIKSGVLDMIHTDHCPEVIESKDVEFDQAHHGLTMLETAMSAYWTFLSKEIELEDFVKAFSLNPRKRFDLELPKLEEGSKFEFTLFDPNRKWIYNAETAASKSSNSPFYNTELTGKVIVI